MPKSEKISTLRALNNQAGFFGKTLFSVAGVGTGVDLLANAGTLDWSEASFNNLENFYKTWPDKIRWLASLGLFSGMGGFIYLLHLFFEKILKKNEH